MRGREGEWGKKRVVDGRVGAGVKREFSSRQSRSCAYFFIVDFIVVTTPRGKRVTAQRVWKTLFAEK